ncbi:hypothetical protein P280DRAFT_519883 [Massarina eburnea CBS 473.64]|uniref:SAC3/GANP/THP3 conserved domain-containing protein n=1 Tax=Massarina eburnea CBS 473.64 TaxID=1395130 RepID=A0A6A6RYJ0_9PLEO|nr:hypothetical protein P280DRAFT_519883 [Massarina eburnea CBS 473.64]
MSTGRRGHRGGADRGARGARGGNNTFRGNSARGRSNGTGTDAPSGPAFTRDNAQDALRGGRGGLNARGDRAPFRGRGNYQAGPPLKAPSSTSSTPSTTYDPDFVSHDPMNSTPFARNDYVNRLAYLRDARPRIREALVDQGLMNPPGQIKLEDGVRLIGACTEMCPEFERVRRIIENDYKLAECTRETCDPKFPRNQRVVDESRMVKAFTRSAAGVEEELVTEKRTPTTCLNTLNYMWKRIDEDGIDFVFAWVWDRTRSIRKDLNGKCRPEEKLVRVTSFEQCTRFHLFSMHQMAGSKSTSYDQANEHHQDITQLTNSLKSLRPKYAGNMRRSRPSPNLAEFLAYDVILSITFEDSFLKLNAEDYRGDSRVETAIAIREAANIIIKSSSMTFSAKKRSWNYFWQVVGDESVPFLMACAAEISFIRVRHGIMKSLRYTYSARYDKAGELKPTPKNDWTIEALYNVLGFDTEQEVRLFCEMYGVGFITNQEGLEVLNLGAMPAPGTQPPPEVRPQHFSKTIVHPKRRNQDATSIIQGSKGNDGDQNGSLFVPDKNPFMSRMNPNATKFTPPAVSPFSYLSNPSTTPASSIFGGQAGATPTAPVQPGLFDPSKNSIQFANNAFAKAAAATTPTNGAPAPPAANSKPFTSTGFSSNAGQPAQAASQAFQPPSQPVDAQRVEERRKAAEQQRLAEEQQRIANEQRRAQEEQERQAREAAQQRRLQEEYERQRLIQAEQDRQRLAQEQAQREAFAEHQRQLQAHQLRQAQEAAAQFEREETARAYNALATNLLMDDDQGLMAQMIEHMIGTSFQSARNELQDERLGALAEDMYEKKRLAFARAMCFRWWEQVQKKKKKAETRTRRQNLKALRARAAAEAANVVAPEVQPPNAPQNNSMPSRFKKPEAPANTNRPQTMQRSQTTSSAQPNNTLIREKPAAKKKNTSITRTSSVTNRATPDTALSDYSESYYKSTAPIDRTETDWFELRAMGIDPSTYRKRKSLEIDDEEDVVVDKKRARRSPSSTFRRSLPPSTTDEDRISRFRALQASFNNGFAAPRSIDGTRSTNGKSDLISRARELLTGSPTPQHSPPSVSQFRRSDGSGFSQPAPQLSMFGHSIGAAPPSEIPAYRSRASHFVPQHLYGKGAEAVRAYREQYYGRTPVKNEPLQLSSPVPTQQSYVHTGETQPEYYGESELELNGTAEAMDEDDESVIDYSDMDSDDDNGASQAHHLEFDEFDEGQGHGEYGEEGFEEEEDYDEDEDIEEDGGFQYAQNPGPGATQDDAIELSD